MAPASIGMKALLLAGSTGSPSLFSISWRTVCERYLVPGLTVARIRVELTYTATLGGWGQETGKYFG